jgi:hypothetical protein
MTPPPNGPTTVAEIEQRLLDALESRLTAKPPVSMKAEIARAVIAVVLSAIAAYFAMDKRVAVLDSQINGKSGIVDRLDVMSADIKELLRRVR